MSKDTKEELVGPSPPLVKQLEALGLLPPRCYSWTLNVHVGEAAVLHTESYVTSV